LVSLILLLRERGFGQMVQKSVTQSGGLVNQTTNRIFRTVYVLVVIIGMTSNAFMQVKEYTHCLHRAFVLLLIVKDTHATKLIVQAAHH